MNFIILLGFIAIAPPSEDPEKSHEQAGADLQAAIDNATIEDRAAAIASLSSAIDLHGQYPDEANSTVPESLLEAHVILIRLYLAENNTHAAEQAMDELIRTARD